MYTLSASINKLVSKIGRITGLETYDWSTSFESFDSLKDQNKITVLSDITKIIDKKTTKAKITILTTIFYLLNSGVELANDEMEKIFFAASRLYEDDNKAVRRLTNLLMCKVASNSNSNFMLQSLASNDLTNVDEWIQANAFKIFIKLFPINSRFETELGNILVSKKPYLTLNCINSFIELSYTNQEIVEVLKKFQHKLFSMLDIPSRESIAEVSVGASVVILLAIMNQNDYTNLSRVVNNITNDHPIICMRLVILLRAILLSNDFSINKSSFLTRLNDLLKHPSDLVSFEAAKTIICLAEQTRNNNFSYNISDLNLQLVGEVLCKCLSHTELPVKHAALSKFYSLAKFAPNLVKSFSYNIELCASEGQTLLIVMALLTLLLCGSTKEKKSMLNKIKSRIYELPESMKIELINGLCALNYIDKDILDFLLVQLRDGEGKESKLYIGIKLCELCNQDKLKKTQLFNYTIDSLCELIEDCSHEHLLCYLIRFLAIHIPNTSNSISKARYIINRLMLESVYVQLTCVSILDYLCKVTPDVQMQVYSTLVSLPIYDNDNELRTNSIYLAYQIAKKANISTSSYINHNINEFIQYMNTYDEKYTSQFNNININYDIVLEQIISSLNTSDQQIVSIDMINELSNTKKIVQPAIGISYNIEKQSNVDNYIEELFSNKIKLNGKSASSRPFKLTLTDDDMQVSCSFHQYFNDNKALVIEFEISNTLSYIDYKEICFHINKTEKSNFSIIAITDNIDISSLQKATVYLLLEFDETIITFFDENNDKSVLNDALINELHIDILYKCLEEGSTKYYDEHLSLNPIQISLNTIAKSTVKKNIELKCIDKIKFKCRNSFKKPLDAISYLKNYLYISYNDDIDIENKTYFYGEILINNIYFEGYAHIVESPQGLLGLCIIYSNNEKLNFFFKTYLQYLLS